MKPTWCTIYVSAVYSVTIPLHVSGLLVAPGGNVYMQQIARIVRFSWLSAGLVGVDDGQLVSLTHVEV
jgi:hypothetical protein